MITKAFIVSTGRCGSTLLSNALRLHPDVASISEFFGNLSERVFKRHMTIWDQIARPLPLTSFMLTHQLEPPEFVYRVDGGGAYDRKSGVPPILCATLPHVFAGPDDVFRNMASELRESLQHRRPGAGYETVFHWITCALRRRVWVERSGASLRWLPELHASFDDARFIHLYRNGRDSAMSMSRHNTFRFQVLRAILARTVGADPFDGPGLREAARLAPEFRRLVPTSFSRHDFLRYPFSLTYFALIWTYLIASGLSYFARIRAENLLHVRFEDVVSDPCAALGEIGRFLSLEEDASWIASASELVRSAPRLSSTSALLDPRAEQIIQRGVAGLRRAGLNVDGYF